jgi:hypothetical protein
VQKVESDVALIGRSGQQGCDGDSGGPALLSVNGVETLIATDDYNGGKIDCTGGDYYQRVDAELDFIQPFLTAAPAATAAPPATSASAPATEQPSTASTSEPGTSPVTPSTSSAREATTPSARQPPPATPQLACSAAPAGNAVHTSWAWLSALGLVLAGARRGGRRGTAALRG